MKALYFVIALLITSNFAMSQQHKVLYDNWPTTVPSNAERQNINIDVQAKYVPIGRTWDHRIITYFFQNGTPDITGNDERQAVIDAMALWTAATKIRFLEVCAAGEADIVFAWAAGAHGDPNPSGSPTPPGDFDGVNGTLAHCLGGPPPNANGAALAGDIHFDEDETWTLAARPDGTQPIDLVTIAAHELGHSLGLDHTSVAGALMLPNYTGSHRFLSSDEVSGIQSLYGIPSNDFIVGPAFVCPNGTFTLPDLPGIAGATLVWSSSNPSVLSINSATGFATRTSNGSVTITATVTTGCGGSLIFTKTVTVDVPSPPSSLIVMMGPSSNQLCRNGTMGIAAGHPLISVQGVTKYNWNFGSWASNFSYYDNIPVTNGRAYFNLNSGSASSQSISVTAENACGNSAAYTTTFYAVNCGGFKMSYPNPAKDVVTLSFDTNASELLPERIELISEKTQKASIIFNEKDISEIIGSDGILTMKVARLPRGVYYLHLITPKGEKSEKIRILLE